MSPGERAYEWLGFGSMREYCSTLKQTPLLLRQHAFAASNEYTRLGDGSTQLKKALNGVHVTFLGVGEWGGQGLCHIRCHGCVPQQCGQVLLLAECMQVQAAHSCTSRVQQQQQQYLSTSSTMPTAWAPTAGTAFQLHGPPNTACL